MYWLSDASDLFAASREDWSSDGYVASFEGKPFDSREKMHLYAFVASRRLRRDGLTVFRSDCLIRFKRSLPILD